jgi:hypothetical protein
VDPVRNRSLDASYFWLVLRVKGCLTRRSYQATINVRYIVPHIASWSCDPILPLRSVACAQLRDFISKALRYASQVNSSTTRRNGDEPTSNWACSLVVGIGAFDIHISIKWHLLSLILGWFFANPKCTCFLCFIYMSAQSTVSAGARASA